MFFFQSHCRRDCPLEVSIALPSNRGALGWVCLAQHWRWPTGLWTRQIDFTWFYYDNVERVVLMLPTCTSHHQPTYKFIFILIFIFQLSIRDLVIPLIPVVPLPLVWHHPGSRITPREPALCSHLTPSRRMFGNTHGSTIGATSATVMGLWAQAFSGAKNTLDLEGCDNCCSLEVMTPREPIV